MRPAGDHRTFAHSGWTPEITAVTGDATYTAVFTEIPNTYTVSWIVDGTVTEQKLAYGSEITAPENPAKAGDELYVYTFSHWSGFHDGTTVTGDVAYEAMFMRENVSYTVHFALEDCPLDLVIEDRQVPWGETVTLDDDWLAEGYSIILGVDSTADVRRAQGSSVS